MERGLTIHVRDHDPMTILNLSGHLFQLEVYKLKTQVKESLNANRRYIIVNLSQTEFIDSAGLGVMSMLRERCDDSKATLAIVLPQHQGVRATLDKSRLDQIIPCHESLETAIGDFSSKYGLTDPRSETERWNASDPAGVEMMIEELGKNLAGRLEAIERRLLDIESHLKPNAGRSSNRNAA